MDKKQIDMPSSNDKVPGNNDTAPRHNKDALRSSFNNRISYLCRLAALIISVIIFTTTILGRDIEGFVILGLSLSVALVAIAGMQNDSKPKDR